MVLNARRTAIVLLPLLFVVTCLGEFASAHATKPLPKVAIRGKVLVGDAKSFHSIAIVSRREVFDVIPAIRTLRAEKTGKDSARYHFLVYEANREFQRALLAAAARRGVDLVVEEGGVEAAGIEVADLTADAIAFFKQPVKK